MKKISFIIPTYNEENYIGLCIESIITACIYSEYCKFDYEILVLDGCSSDNTVTTAIKFRDRSDIRVFRNEKRILAAGWNLGIANARFEYICAMNAHATLSINYVDQIIRKFLEYSDLKVGAIGPVLNTKYLYDDQNGRAIAYILGSKFGVGNSKFRTGTSEDQFVDTLHCCVYKKEAINSIDHFDENLVRSQDIDFNKRLILNGYKLLLINSAKVNYFSKIHPEKFIHYVMGNGYWVTYPLRYGVAIGSIRHYVPLGFICYLIALPFIVQMISPLLLLPLLVYFSLLSYYSFFDNKFNLNLRIRIVKYFFIQHFFYGLGSLLGLLQVMRGKL